MIIGTGKTVYEQIISVNEDNYPVTGATFDIAMYRDGFIHWCYSWYNIDRC